MKRLSSLLVGAVCAMLAFGPSLSYAQEYPPPPPPPGYPPPPPPPGYPPPPPQGYPPPPPEGYPPPPPQYYAPPPPNMYPPPPQVERQPPNGLGLLITGAVMFPVGVILLGTSVILWDDSVCVSNTFGGCGSSTGLVAGAATMDVFGSAMVVLGAIFIPVGIVQMAKYGRWKKSHMGGPPPQAGTFNLGHGWAVTPSITGGANGGRAGLSFSF